MDFANFSHSTLEMRAVFFSVTGARWTSANAQIIPADGGAWHHLAFGLGPADLVLVAGTDTYTQCMSNVTRLMFRHDAGTPSSGGTAIVAVGGFDNVLAAPAPGGVALLALAGLGTGRRRR